MYSGKQAVCDQLAHGPMDKIILQLVDSFKELSLPVRSIQLDDWCESGNAALCRWQPKPALAHE